jgi:hypothetical protein
MLHRLLTYPSKSTEPHHLSSIHSTRDDVIENSMSNITENPNNKSPQYRPRHSYFNSSKLKQIPSNNTKLKSGKNLNK